MDAVYRFNHISIGAGAIWATSSDQRSHYYYRLDPASGKISALYSAGAEVDDIPVDITADATGVWVALVNGKLLKVDPGNGQILTQVVTKPGLGDIFIDGTGLWAENYQEAEVYHIDPGAVQVLAAIRLGTRPIPTPTSTPRVLETATCDAHYATRLEVGERAFVSEDPPTPNRVRESPSRDAKIIKSIDPGETVMLLEGPVCAESWVWWRIQSVERPEITGWTSEGDEDGYWLVPE
jgi:hypothetical protein